VSDVRVVTNKKTGVEKEVRDIKIQDSTSEIRLSLWEGAATVVMQAGEDVLIKDATVTFNTFFNETTLTVGDSDSIQVRDYVIPS
jgi:ssDNA-binding replication factor A large subunit